MQPLKIDWLLSMAHSVDVSAAEIFSGLHSAITGFTWLSAGGEANNLMSRIQYRRKQVPAIGLSIVRKLKYDRPDMATPFSDEKVAADRVAGLVMLDTGMQLDWTIQRKVVGEGLDVVRRAEEYRALSGVDYGLALRRDALGWADMTVAQLQAFRVKAGRVYNRRAE